MYRTFLSSLIVVALVAAGCGEPNTDPLGPGGKAHQQAGFTSVVVAPGGRLMATFDGNAHPAAEVLEYPYQGGKLIATLGQDAVEQLTDCIAGGETGRTVTYRERVPRTRDRQLSFYQYDAALAAARGLPTDPHALELNFSALFGRMVGATLTSGAAISGTILPGQYGVFYRRTTKLILVAQLYVTDGAGGRMSLGEVLLTDWVFNLELATGNSCTPPASMPASSVVVEREAPEPVSACIEGADIGRQVEYVDQPITRQRAISYRYDADAGALFDLPDNANALPLQPAEIFGVDANVAASSGDVDLSGHVLPAEVGMFYRQATKIHRTARLSFKGEGSDIVVPLGEMVLTDWVFGVDLATGLQCPPRTNLPPALAAQ